MNYVPKLQPYVHQTDALNKMRHNKTFALLMAMRTGKTKVLLDDFGMLESDKQICIDLLVIAPAGVYRTWETAIKDHMSDDLQSRLMLHTFKSGRSQIDKLQTFLTYSGPRCLLMNVEALSRAGEARELCKLFLTRSAMLVIDESTIIKNPTAKRTKFIITNLAPLSKYRRILSGLPTPRSPLDIFSQMEFLDWTILGYRSFYAFRNRYAIMKPMNFGGRMVQIVDGYRYEDELQKLIAPHSFRVEFRPNIPSTYTIREVTLTEQQQKAYDELKNFATTKLENEAHVTATVVITQILRMHQILCGHVKDEMNQFHSIPELRTKELVELLEDYAGKAVIWCSYDYDIRKVAKVLTDEYGPEAIARFWGGNANTRESEEKSFLTSPLCRFMIATPSAGGRGRTWTPADLVIYYSSTNNLEHRDQSEQRVQGIDKNRQVDYIDLVAPNTVDIKILQALRDKIDMATTINGDNYREWLI